jgi:hypothetical protein
MITEFPVWYSRFWDKVEISEYCWNWIGAVDAKGYPRFNIDGINRRAVRVIYELEHGSIPEGMLICHTCDNRRCIRLEHLFVGTNEDNMVDMAKKGRGLKVLTKEQATEIFNAKGRQADIANEFGISQAMVSLIKNRVRHKTMEVIP